MYLDTVQFQKNGVQNRNQIKTPEGALWLTVPVNARLALSIREIRIDNQHWQQKHLRSIRQNVPGAGPVSGLVLRGTGPDPGPALGVPVELNIATTEWLFARLGISCRRVRASELKAVGAREDLVINICRELGADVYLSGQGAKAYQAEADFRAQGIDPATSSTAALPTRSATRRPASSRTCRPWTWCSTAGRTPRRSCWAEKPSAACRRVPPAGRGVTMSGDDAGRHAASIGRVRDYWEEKARRAETDCEKIESGRRAQCMRFEAFVIHHELRGKSILDVGCGVGDFWQHLQKRGVDCQYLGVDIAPAMVQRAKGALSRAAFECRNILEWQPGRQFDYCVAFGIHANVRLGSRPGGAGGRDAGSSSFAGSLHTSPS